MSTNNTPTFVPHYIPVLWEQSQCYQSGRASDEGNLEQINGAFKLPNYSFEDNEGRCLLCRKQSMSCEQRRVHLTWEMHESRPLKLRPESFTASHHDFVLQFLKNSNL